MLLKLILFTATLYVVSASVITLNAYDDPEKGLEDTEENPTLRKCNNQECDQRCRRLKFRGGACVNGRCKCDNFRTSEDAVMERAEYTLDSRDSQKERRCIPRICSRICRLLRFDNGTCVNERCKCGRKVKESTDSDEAHDNQEKGYQQMLGNNIEDPEKGLEDTEENPTLRKCNNQECDQRCRRLKFRGGACVNGRCKCDNFRTSEDFASVIEQYVGQRKCDPRECHQRCRKLQFPGGACVNGRCKCDNFRTAEVEGFSTAGETIDNEIEESDLSLGELEDAVVESAEYTLESRDAQKKRRCIPRICSRICRLLRFDNGTCVNERCKCGRKVKESTDSDDAHDNQEKGYQQMLGNNIEDKESNADESNVDDANNEAEVYKQNIGENLEVAEFAPVLADSTKELRCVPRICNLLCYFLRRENGTCVNGRCKCRRQVTELQTTDVTSSNEAEELKLNLDEELAEPVIENAEISADPTELVKKIRCAPNICNRVCRLKRRGNGTCVDGRCQCYKKATPEPYNDEELEESHQSDNED